MITRPPWVVDSHADSEYLCIRPVNRDGSVTGFQLAFLEKKRSLDAVYGSSSEDDARLIVRAPVLHIELATAKSALAMLVMLIENKGHSCSGGSCEICAGIQLAKAIIATP